jgi:hypothetical protein
MGHISFWLMLARENIVTINKDTETLIVASKEVGLGVNREN